MDNNQEMIFKESGEVLNMIEGLPFGMITFDSEGRIEVINRQAKDLLILRKEISDLIESPILSITKNEKFRNVIKRILEGKRKSFTLQRILVDERYLTIRGKKLSNTMLITLIDNTESVKAVDLATLNLIVGQEKERARLAKEIHDGIGPMMSTIRLQIDTLSRLAATDAVKVKLLKISEMITETAKDIRQISHDLQPSSLKDFGLTTAIENFVKRISTNDENELEIFFSHKLKNVELSEILELNLFRIVQELVNNALKYAQCTVIDIQLRSFDDQLQLTVEDNGIGMDTSTHKKGMGLQNIKTRCKILHGTFDIESQPGQGFLAQIIVPLNPPA